ncbi:long-chain fatty acid--CoA ligase [Candidatus Levibacter sp. Uisw_134_01]|uniref:AMP-dependent synthetase/ligase n=1 Tax=Candidatus Levibacter sp. Uisw_134_01 TaxID=3230999 RepID=UPI003D574021
MNTLPSLFFKNTSIYQNKTLFGFKDGKSWKSISWNKSSDFVQNIALGLHEIGVKKSDKITLIAENSYKWCIVDLSIMSLGAITVPGYITSNEEEIFYLLSHSDSSFVFVNSTLLPVILKILPKLKKIKYVINIDDNSKDDLKKNSQLYNYNQLLEMGNKSNLHDKFLETFVNKINQDDVVSLIYTSGTSSNPKAVMLTNKSTISNLLGAYELVKDIDIKEHRFLSIIPLSHAYEHTAGFLLPVYIGAEIYFNDNRDKIVNDLQSVRPTLMIAVPRLYEVLFKKINNQLLTQNKLAQKLFFKTIELGTKDFQCSKLTFFEKITNNLLDLIIRKKIKKKFGGQLQAFISGGAALNNQVGLFFQSLGINILQGYGQTECSPLISCNPMNSIKIDTVGPVIKGLEVKISEQKEILVKGNSVMKGYWKDQKSTNKVIVNGWLHTGDLGELDKDNYIKITGRINEMIVSSGGDNIAPVPIENLLLAYDEIEQVMVYGHNRPFLTAIIVPNENLINDVSKNIVKDYSIFQAIVNKVNKQLSQSKKIRKFLLTDKSFNIENNELTPTLKIKRRIVSANYAEQLDKLYKKSFF